MCFFYCKQYMYHKQYNKYITNNILLNNKKKKMLWQPKHKVMSKSMCTGTWLNLAVLICQHRETATAVGYWAGLCVVSYPGLIEQICARTWLYSFTEAHQNALLNCSYNQQKSKASNGIITSDKSS